MKKALLALLPLSLVLSLVLGSCSGGEKTAYTVAIGQFGEHASLDNTREGFLQGLREAGFTEGENLTVVYKNASFNTDTCGLIAKDFVSSKVDLICAIATPMAQAAYNNAYEAGIPVVFSAITDPAAANLTGGEVTGTSDILPVEAQLKLIRALMPDAENIGILYTTSEDNSLSSLAVYRTMAAAYGFRIVDRGITVSADLPLALEGLLPQVDCITNLTDNTVVGSLAMILDRAGEAGIPVFGSEITQMQAGCIAGEGLDYIDLGKQTGAIAAKILRGEAKASEIEFEIIKNSYLYVNREAMEQFGLTLPEDLAERAIFTE